MILISLQKLPKNGGDWGKLIVAKGFKKLPKVQNIAQSGHTARSRCLEQFSAKRNYAMLLSYKTSGQSYKLFMIVIYDSRVVIWGNFKSGTTLES